MVRHKYLKALFEKHQRNIILVDKSMHNIVIILFRLTGRFVIVYRDIICFIRGEFPDYSF